jgi:hypothetical protein
MKKIIWTLLVCTLIVTMVLAQRPSGVIYKTTTVPVIDGEIDNVWTSAIQYNIGKNFKSEEPTLGDVGTTYWKALWNDNGMYILVVVNDDVWYPYTGTGNSYEYDRVELYFDTNYILEDGLGGQDSPTGNRMFWPDLIIFSVDGTIQSFDVRGFIVNYAYKVTDPKWNAEYFIPWDCIPDKNGVRFNTSGTMGFDVDITDNDNDGKGRKRALWSNDGTRGVADENWNNMDEAGHLTFQDLVYIEGGSPKTFVYGETGQLSAKNNFINPGTLTYSWSPSEGLSQTDIPNPIVTVSTDQTYTLTVTTSDGSTETATVNIKVIPFAATTVDQTISCGNAVQLDVTTNYTGSGTLTYHWEPKDKLDNPAVKNPVATVTQPTDFVVEVTTPNGTTTQTNVHVDVSKTNYQPALCLVTVDTNNKNVLVWNKPDDISIKDYLIFRESMIQTDFYDLIGSVASGEEPVYTDLSSNALVQSNKYKIAARDNCGFITNQSFPHKTMHLSINKGQGNSWNLIWETYDGFTVSSYKIYRGDSPENLSLIGSTAGSANSYSDFNANEGDVYYQIEAFTFSSCSLLKSTDFSGSRSNIATNSDVSVSALSNDELSIYPVPVKDRLYINKDFNCISEVVVLSIDGRIEMSFKKPVKEENINVSSLKRGVHVLKIAADDGIYVQKFIKG